MRLFTHPLFKKFVPTPLFHWNKIVLTITKPRISTSHFVPILFQFRTPNHEQPEQIRTKPLSNKVTQTPSIICQLIV